MSIANYTELQNAVANWLRNTDASTYAADFISLADAKLRRRLRMREMEQSTTLTVLGTTDAVALPSDFVEMRSIGLEYMSPHQMSAYWGDTQGDPVNYSLAGDELIVAPVPGDDYDIDIRYFAWTPLSGAAPTNWLLTNYPDVYLYGALLEAEGLLQNDARVGVWKAQFDLAVAELEDADEQGRTSGSNRVITGPMDTP